MTVATPTGCRPKPAICRVVQLGLLAVTVGPLLFTEASAKSPERQKGMFLEENLPAKMATGTRDPISGGYLLY